MPAMAGVRWAWRAAKRQDGWGALSAYAKADKRQLSDEQWEWWRARAARGPLGNRRPGYRRHA